MFQYDAMVPILIDGTRVNWSFPLTILLSLAAYVFMQKSFMGYRLQVGGLAPRAAGYAGFSEVGAIWMSLLIGGFAAGLAGAAGEVAGPIGQLQRSISTGYGYAAIIVAYLGGLHPLGILVSSLLMAVLYIGGDTAMVSAELPIAAVRVFQGSLLIAYLIAVASCATGSNGRPPLTGGRHERGRLHPCRNAGCRHALSAVAALGELVAERAGVLNLGVEGLMALGAVVAFIIVYHGGGHVLAFLAAGLAGVLLSLLFALVALGFRANQVATGLAIGILGQGLSALFGKSYESLTVKGLPKIALPGLSDLPVVGGLFSTGSRRLAVAGALTLAIWPASPLPRPGSSSALSARTRRLPMRSAIPFRVFAWLQLPLAACWPALPELCIGRLYAALGRWLIAGRGWIAIALVVFGTWLTGRIFLGACLFGAVSLMSLAAQATGVELPSQLLSSLPYLITIIVSASSPQQTPPQTQRRRFTGTSRSSGRSPPSPRIGVYRARRQIRVGASVLGW